MTPADSATRTTALQRWGWLLLIALAGLGVYANSMQGEFVFDDFPTIVESPSVRHLTPLSRSLTGEAGSTVSGRPVAAFSLALNFAAGGLDVFGYHLVNVLCHVLAALALFGLLRLTSAKFMGAAHSRHSLVLAGCAALLWVLHPLHTDALNHISYRTETMMALFYLASMYAAARAFAAQGSRTWLALSALGAFLAMGSKEAAVSLPLIILLYDRQFAAGSIKAALVGRKAFYAALLVSWFFLGYLVQSAERGETVGFEVEAISSLDYLRTQAHGLWLYLRLSLWPHPLVFDYYGVEVIKSWGDVWLEALGLLALFAWTLVGVVRKRAWSLPALAVFAVLAPSSSFIPLAGEVLAEHRMVLPLAALIPLAVFGLQRVLPHPKALVSIVLPVALLFGLLTFSRNTDYRTQEAIWRDTTEKQPNNPRAFNNLFKPLIERGDLAGAEAVLRRSIELRPKSARGLNNLGILLMEREQWDEAQEAFERSLKLRPDRVDTHYNLAQLHAARHRWPSALEQYAFVAQDTPLVARGHTGMGQALVRLGKRAEAAEALRRAISVDARAWPAVRLLSWIYSTSRDPALRDAPEALRLAELLCSSRPRPTAGQQEVLAAALAANGRFEEALKTSEAAAKLARRLGDERLAQAIQARAKSYARGEAHRE